MSEEIKILPNALCTGDDTFNGIKVIASILDDEDRTHVFSERSLANLFGFKGGGSYWKRKKLDSAVLPEYLSSPILNEFINNDLKEKLDSAVSYIATNKKISTGLEATILPLICDVYFKASQKYPENETLRRAGETAYRIILAFSQFGVLKYVEQITGYRYTDEDTQIVKSLKEYGVSPTIVEWQREFQTDFYRNIYRLRGWPYNPKSTARPSVIGTYTNQYVYSYLPKDVFQWIKDNTPKNKEGKFTKKLFQSLDEKVGKEKLRNQMVSVTTMLKLSNTWDEFKTFFARSLGQSHIDFKEPKMILPTNKLLERSRNKAIQMDLFGNLREIDKKGNPGRIVDENGEPISDFNINLKTALNYNPKNKE